MAHAAFVDFAIVLDHVDDEGDSPVWVGAEEAAHLAEGRDGAGEVVEDEDGGGDVDRFAVEGDAVEGRLDEIDILEFGEAALGGGEHGAGAVDGVDALGDGGEEFGDVARAAADVGDDHVAGEEREEGHRGEAGAEEFVAEGVPFAADAAEEGLAVGLALVEDGAEAARIFAEFGGGAHLLAHGAPECASLGRKVVQDEAVERGGALAASGDPAAVGEDLEVAADGGLRKLDNLGDFAHGEFLGLEEAEDAQADHLAECGEAVGDGDGRGRAFHPFMRMNGRTKIDGVKPSIWLPGRRF